MRRRTFDALATTAGLLLAAVLLTAGILLGWAHSFVTNEVHSQLASQKIEFPTKTNPEFKALPKADAAAMGQYAGQQMTTGAQAETYADHFIAYHLTLIGGGKTYSQLSAESLAQPTNAKLAGQVQTVFRGDTLRSMLLNAYGFGKMGEIAGIASISPTAALACCWCCRPSGSCTCAGPLLKPRSSHGSPPVSRRTSADEPAAPTRHTDTEPRPTPAGRGSVTFAAPARPGRTSAAPFRSRYPDRDEGPAGS